MRIKGTKTLTTLCLSVVHSKYTATTLNEQLTSIKLVTGLGRLLILTHRIFTKERMARRDHGNQASTADRAHMKRP